MKKTSRIFTLAFLGLTLSLSVAFAQQVQSQQQTQAAESMPKANTDIVPKAETIAVSPALLTLSKLPTGDEPFGANLFSTQSAIGSKEPMNPNYQIVPGDQIEIQSWGAVTYNSTVTVDNQGNIFLPEIGPVHVLGTTQAALNNVVRQAVERVYKDNVKVYTALRGSLPISVFVSGAVKTPGRYLGVSTDSVLDYLYKAGGIDPDRGSYRDVQIIRNNAPVQKIDIYDFLLNGKMEKFQIRESDTILVKERGKVVTVKGGVKNPFKFEFKGPDIKGADVITFAAPLNASTNVKVTGTRINKPYETYVSLDNFTAMSLEDGDRLEFSSGTHGDKMAVTVAGRHKGPKILVLPLDANLREGLDNIPVDPAISNIDAVYLKRRSVAASQKAAIKDSLQRLEEMLVLSTSSGITQKSTIEGGDVTLLNSFMERAERVEPEGRVVFNDHRSLGSVLLEDGDEIVIPQKTNLVMVNGQVLLPKAVLWENGISVSDYISKAGGFAQNANENAIVIVRANGETVLGKGVDIKPGDEIMVMPEIKVNSLEITGEVADIIYKVAVAAAVPFNISR